jgi:RepB DNA-primase from phage plasmid
MMAHPGESGDVEGAPNALLGNTDASIEFLQERAATHPSWHPQLSFKGTNRASGEESAGFETASFPREANGNPDWDKVRRWIDNRQGRGNIYWTVNAAKVMDKKPTKKDIDTVVSLHVDLDPGADEDQDAAEERLTKAVEDYRLRASIIVKSGGGVWAFYDLVEPIRTDGDRAKIEEVEAHNKALAHDLGGDNCHNIDRVARLPGTVNVPNAKKRAKGRRAKVASVHSRNPGRHAIEAFTKAVVDAVTEAKRAPLLADQAAKIARIGKQVIVHCRPPKIRRHQQSAC